MTVAITKKKKKSEEIAQQIDKQKQEIQDKFDHWNKILDQANDEADKIFQYAITVKNDAIKDMGYRLEKEGFEKHKISKRLIQGFNGRISPTYISRVAKRYKWTNTSQFTKNRFIDADGTYPEGRLDDELSVDELEFETKDNMDVLIHYWLDMDIQKLINIKHDVPKGENWRKIVFDTAKDNILNRWKQLDDMVVNNTVNHNRTLIEMLRYVNDIGHEEQKIRQRNKEMFGK